MDKCYKIVNKSTGYVLDVSNESITDGTLIQVWGFNRGANQIWKLEAIGSNNFKISAQHSGKYLASHTKNSGDDVVQSTYDPSVGAKDWQIICTDDGYYQIKHKLSGLLLDADCGYESCQVEIRTPDGTSSQKWQIQEVPCNQVVHEFAGENVLRLAINAESNRTYLNWLNNTGYKNDYFEVQRLSNTNGKFEKLNTIDATESSNILKSYEDYDNNPQEGENQYRIKVAFKDGSIAYSEIQKVVFKNLQDVRIFPNPASDFINVDLS